jgi:hypothetical protein
MYVHVSDDSAREAAKDIIRERRAFERASEREQCTKKNRPTS